MEEKLRPTLRWKELATPKTVVKLTPSGLAKAKSLLARDYTWAEIAEALGVSVSTIQKALNPPAGEGD